MQMKIASSAVIHYHPFPPYLNSPSYIMKALQIAYKHNGSQ